MRTLARVLLTGLLLSLIACASTRVDSDYNKGYSFRPLGTPPLGPGDLMLEVIDPRNQRVVWRGWGQRLIPVNEAPMSKKMAKAVEQAVQKILQDFPPR